jgi:hypothetical protein
MNIIRDFIRTILLENQQEIDRILDKINNVGYNDLTVYEKDVLNKSSAGKFSSIDNDAIAWLNKFFGNLKSEKMTRNSFGREIEEIVFFDDNMDTVMTLETKSKAVGITRKSNVIYIDYIIWQKLQEYFGLEENQTKEVLKKWLSATYGLNGTSPAVSL